MLKIDIKNQINIQINKLTVLHAEWEGRNIIHSEELIPSAAQHNGLADRK
jgi:hypothetical protein